MLMRIILRVILRVVGLLSVVGLRPVGLRQIGRRRKQVTVKFEQTVAAGSAVGEVGFNALIGGILIARTLVIATLIDHALISGALIVAELNSHTLLGALMLVTLDRLRSRTGSSNPVVFNLSTAQMLRLFCHWSHISLI